MLVQSIQLHKSNKLIQEYRKEQDFVMDYFEYTPFSQMKKRMNDVQQIKRDRHQLAELLYTMNKNWDAPISTFQQIERLKDETSVVVIGGQQAGVLTGPLYSLNKLISVYRYAKEQEDLLGVPVIPLFWIAGEDHDYDEINHIFTLRDEKIMKHSTKQQEFIKRSVSHMDLDKEKTEAWLREAFLDLQETKHTKHLYNTMVRCLEQSSTFVDFFARVMFTMFKEEGIVFVDSANEQLRQFESDHFIRLIQSNESIARDVYETVQTLQQSGYEIPLEVEREDSHIFFHDENGERILLKREAEKYTGKNNEVIFTEAELKDIAKTTPEKLSNNVITRPLMQEMLFPTLAFIAGDGEISYWAALKKAFHHVGEKMPPVVPRLSFTYIPQRIEKLLQQRVIKVENAIRDGVGDKKINWLATQQQQPIEQVFNEVRKQLSFMHKPLQTMAENIAPDLHEVSKTNEQLILEQIDYLHHKTNQTLESQYEDALRQFDEIDIILHPNNGLQERVYSPLPLLNEYGFRWIELLNEHTGMSFKEEHFVIYLQSQ